MDYSRDQDETEQHEVAGIKVLPVLDDQKDCSANQDRGYETELSITWVSCSEN